MPYTGPFGSGYTNMGTVDGIVVANTEIDGTLGNTGTISPNGIKIINSAIVTPDYNLLAIWDEDGSISGGISIDSTSSLKGRVWVEGDVFNGDVYNAGSITGTYGILIYPTAFTGNVINAGSITGFGSGGIGIELTHAHVTGSIINSGTISSGNNFGVYILQSGLSGTISNTGTITGSTGIFMDPGVRGGSGPQPPLASAPALNIFDSGTITGTGGVAVKLAPATIGNNIFTLGAGYHINGDVLGAGGDALQLGGIGGSDTFDLSLIGTQYTGFAHFNVVGATWTVSGSGSNWDVEDGVLQIASGAALSDTRLDGGELTILAGGTADHVTFGAGAATLALENPAALTGGLTNWHLGDSIDFLHTAVTSASIGNNGAVLSIITSDGHSYGYDLTGLEADAQVSLQSDGSGGTLVQLTAGVTPITAAHYLPADFNGDGTPDLLWRGSNGTLVEWQFNNGQQSGPGVQLLGDEGSPWQVAGVGDFNHDGMSDLLLRNTDGTLVEWQMNNGQQSGPGIQLLGKEFADWQFAAVGDFNHDGTSDILLRNPDGTVIEWQMSNGQQSGPGIQLLGKEGANWQVAGVGDFNHDGTQDILWRGNDGTLIEWRMNNGQQSGPGVQLLGKDGANWQVAGVGDFNRDGTSDILLRNTDGTLIEWQMNNGQQAGPGIQLLGKDGATWQVAGVSDFNRDGTDDILLRAVDGTVLEWQMHDGQQAGPGIGLIGGHDGSGWHLIA